MVWVLMHDMGYFASQIANNRHGVTITTHVIKCHFLIWMTMVRQPRKHRRSCVLILKYTFICVYWWTRQRIHNTLIVVNQYLRLTGDKMITDSAGPRLESFYPPFVAGIDLPHQGVVDFYNLRRQRVDRLFPYGAIYDISDPCYHCYRNRLVIIPGPLIRNL